MVESFPPPLWIASGGGTTQLRARVPPTNWGFGGPLVLHYSRGRPRKGRTVPSFGRNNRFLGAAHDW